MIPKTIHYCWFGGGPHSEVIARCLASWRTLLPGYAIKCWNESNSPMHLNYLQTARQHRKWANMSNLVRLHALDAEGGIYLDTDIEVVKPFDDVLQWPAFLGCENRQPIVNNAVFGSEAGHPFLRAALADLTARFDGTERANESSPRLTTRLLKQEGLEGYENVPRLVANVMIFPTRYFYPFHFKETFTPGCVRPETYTIHYWQNSWL